MELVLTNPRTSSINKSTTPTFESHGIMNSNYQNVVKCTFEKTSSTSVFVKRQQIKCSRFRLASNIEALLKFSIFTAVILSIVG